MNFECAGSTLRSLQLQVQLGRPEQNRMSNKTSGLISEAPSDWNQLAENQLAPEKQ